MLCATHIQILKKSNSAEILNSRCLNDFNIIKLQNEDQKAGALIIVTSEKRHPVPFEF